MIGGLLLAAPLFLRLVGVALLRLPPIAGEGFLDEGATLTTRWTLREWPADPPHGEAKAAEKLLAP